MGGLSAPATIATRWSTVMSSEYVKKYGPYSKTPDTFMTRMASVSGSAWKLLGILIYHTNRKTGKAWPSYETLMKETGVGKMALIDATHELEDIGWIKCERRHRKSTIYTVILPIVESEKRSQEELESEKRTQLSPESGLHLDLSYLDLEEREKTAVAALSPLVDSEGAIKAWRTTEQIENVCIWFSRISGAVVTQYDKAKWINGAKKLAALSPMESDISMAIDLAGKQKYLYTHPGGIYEFLKEVLMTPRENTVTEPPQFKPMTRDEMRQQGLI